MRVIIVLIFLVFTAALPHDVFLYMKKYINFFGVNFRTVRPRQRLPVLVIGMNLRAVRPRQRLPFFDSSVILTKYNEEVRLLHYYHKISIPYNYNLHFS